MFRGVANNNTRTRDALHGESQPTSMLKAFVSIDDISNLGKVQYFISKKLYTYLDHQKRKAHFLILSDLIIPLVIDDFNNCCILHLDDVGRAC